MTREILFQVPGRCTYAAMHASSPGTLARAARAGENKNKGNSKKRFT